MKDELTTKIINNDQLIDLEFQRDFAKYKTRDNKFKIILLIFALIFLGFLLILVYKVFFIDSSNSSNSSNSSPIQTGETVECFDIPNDPAFKKIYENFPFSLKIKENGVIETDKSSLDDTSSSTLIYVKEDSYQYDRFELDQESKNSNFETIDFALSSDISYFLHCDGKYKSKVEQAKKKSIKILYYIVKKKLFSLFIKRSDIIINEAFKQKIEDIANEELYTEEEKARELAKLFNEYGYFVPLKITIGGYFYQEINKIENEDILKKMREIEANVNLTLSQVKLNTSLGYGNVYENLFKSLFSNEKIKIIGGDVSKKSFEEWEASLNYENSQIIEYSNIIEISSLIKDFLDRDTKMKLKNVFNLIDKKYEKRKIYYNNIEEAKEYIIGGEITGNINKRNGLCNNDDLIYSHKIKIKGKDPYRPQNSYQDIIVGWRINSNRNDGDNGDYNFYDPIMKKQIYFEFNPKSGFFGKKEQNYDLEICLMKYPDL